MEQEKIVIKNFFEMGSEIFWILKIIQEAQHVAKIDFKGERKME